MAFVAKVTSAGAPDFVPAAERIATFDNDGTLWAEQPLYFQIFFGIDRVKALAPEHPEWKDKEPFKSVLAGDIKGALAGGAPSLHRAHGRGVFEHDTRRVRPHRESVDRHRETSHDRTALLRDGLPAHARTAGVSARQGFKTFIVSGGGIDFMRAFAEKVYGVPPEQVVGSEGKLKFEMRDGTPVLVKLPALDFFDDKENKPIAIQSHIGRRPIAAFGNSDGTWRCCSGRARERARDSASLCATPTPSGSGPRRVAAGQA